MSDALAHCHRGVRALRSIPAWNMCQLAQPVQSPVGPVVCMSSTPGAPAGTSANAPASADRQQHNAQQAAEFGRADVVKEFQSPLPDTIQQRLARIVQSVPGMGPSSRVIDVGSGTGCLIPHMQARGTKDILAVDLSAPMLEELRRRYAASLGHLGNDLGVRTWHGDIVDLPNYLGWAADAAFFNGCFGNMHDPRAALLRCALMLRPGAHIVVSHPMGREWHGQLAKQQPQITPHVLPDRAGMEAIIQGLPLKIADFVDEKDLYIAVLQIPEKYAIPQAPLRFGGKVVTGFGRGSRQMGTPTANIDPAPLEQVLAGLPRGVYFGWARLDAAHDAGWSEDDLQVHKMVMNVGRRPTVNTGDEAATVEVHIMHRFEQDFYGQNLKVVALGYVRPEMRFTGGLPELINRIRMDIAISRNQLEDGHWKAYANDPHLSL
eukprot:CAMPEP_0202862592 /NCGR_PEP_ID=MMETSP1391-20130828/3577_1 /ASSEMBLY_ACC=CAM_ASM_000867 /TAXON_ID=1034604 /ORGANISM="Chlamydomonas leiostraca, Strain SAG 11-49" /LENGTH=433 /DNA_ID=CAMNT_0049542141 /DNA_START=140 /DNA_END=1441 /DNA_ORIENTATION=+